MLKELEEGLKLFGVLEAATKKPKLFEVVFVESNKLAVSVDDFLDNLSVNYSTSQLLIDKEEDVSKYFCDVIQDIGSNGKVAFTYSQNLSACQTTTNPIPL